eukprot:gnl/MRDRNA2_/MRDRNA2_56451_c0_seq2.p1 gnl/MRDRNA2_/MRDRNA2_56451_c0~~gnl/MRDRNA2_/MRDRNA2_56451_c0_seq2.p1  ORF type:complete len:276 (+),score=58.40 gnl/MRDRNA2_/MRDRNA2_56451_c0_seq2:2-829(+)
MIPLAWRSNCFATPRLLQKVVCPSRSAKINVVPTSMQQHRHSGTVGGKAFDAVEALNKTAKDHDGAVELYDAWADTYDDSLRSWGYNAPEKVAEYLKKHMGASIADPQIIDQGCGTGLSGEAILRVFPSATLTGTDCSGDSIKLLHEKKPGLYSHTYVVNLDKFYKDQPSTGIDKVADDFFDGCICVGVTSYILDFEKCIAEWIRIVKPGGVITFTHRTTILDQDAQSAKSVYEKFEAEGKWILMEKTEPMPYMPKNPLPEESEKEIYYITYKVA